MSRDGTRSFESPSSCFAAPTLIGPLVQLPGASGAGSLASLQRL
jgi:hypothetical protein